MGGQLWLSGERLSQAKLPRLGGGKSGSGQGGFPRRGSRPAAVKQETGVREREQGDQLQGSAKVTEPFG